MAFGIDDAIDIGSGLLDFFGGERTNAMSLQMMREQMEFNREEARRERAFNRIEAGKNRNWQTGANTTAWKRALRGTEIQQAYDTKMASTQHQREVADLRAAGLNPILSLGGPGAASPTISAPMVHSSGGAQASGGRASSGMSPHLENTIGKGVSTALASMARRAEVKQLHASTKTQEKTAELVENQAYKVGAEADTEVERKKLLQVQVDAEKARRDDLVASALERDQHRAVLLADKELKEVLKELENARTANTAASTDEIRKRIDHISELITGERYGNVGKRVQAEFEDDLGYASRVLDAVGPTAASAAAGVLGGKLMRKIPEAIRNVPKPSRPSGGGSPPKGVYNKEHDAQIDKMLRGAPKALAKSRKERGK